MVSKSKKSITSPGSGKILQLHTDDVDYGYVKFPNDVKFIGSIAHNTKFGSGKAFVPVLREIKGEKETHIYGFHPTSLQAQHIAGPIKAPDGSSDVTVFGSHVDKQGMLYLCCWNRNSILVANMNKVKGKAETLFCEVEYEEIMKPKDVTTDPRNEKILYVAGSRDTSTGMVYKIVLDQPGGTDYQKSVQADGFSTLAGIKVVNKEIWLCQMYDIVSQDTKKRQSPAVQQWKGNDGKGNVWLANCINAFDTKYALCPAYKVLPEDVVDSVMKSSTSGSGLASIFCCCKKDASKALSLTHNEENEEGGPIRLMFIDTLNVSKSVHMEIFLSEKNDKFSSKSGITHVQHVVDSKKGKGVVACINFEEPRILVMKDTAFRDIIKNETQLKVQKNTVQKKTVQKKTAQKNTSKGNGDFDYV